MRQFRAHLLLGWLVRVGHEISGWTRSPQAFAAVTSPELTQPSYAGHRWCVTLRRADSDFLVFLEFGPTAVVENERAPVPLGAPEYTKVFVTRRASGQDGIDYIAQTDVGLGEVLAGLSADDTRMRDAVLKVIHAS